MKRSGLAKEMTAMIEKKPTSEELQAAYAAACIGAISGVIPLDIQHMMSAKCHLRWGMWGQKLCTKNMNNIIVLQNERTGKVVVFEARPGGDILTFFRFSPALMKAFYRK